MPASTFTINPKTTQLEWWLQKLASLTSQPTKTISILSATAASTDEKPLVLRICSKDSAETTVSLAADLHDTVADWEMNAGRKSLLTWSPRHRPEGNPISAVLSHGRGDGVIKGATGNGQRVKWSVEEEAGDGEEGDILILTITILPAETTEPA